MKYLPFAERAPGDQYQRMLREIVDGGEWVASTAQGEPALTRMQNVMRFDLAQGFPMITDRSISSFWKRGIGELCAFMNGVTTLDGLIAFGCNWWEPWASDAKAEQFGLPPGNLGPASYGGAFHDFPTLDGGRFNQFSNLVRQVKERPDDRVHRVTSWMPAENARGKGFRQMNTIAPCHGDVHVRVINGKLHLHMVQRSGDTPVGVPSNMVQYAALLLMLEHLTGFEAGSYYHTISDGHIYQGQMPAVETLLERQPRPLPTVQLTDEGRQVTDIMDFRMEHFEVTDYDPHPAMPRIPVLI